MAPDPNPPDPAGAEPAWLVLARELQAHAQTGLHFAGDDYARERYRRIAEIANLLLAEGFAVEPQALGAQLPLQEGYATPQIDVRGAIFRGDEVLLVRELADGKWALPGGWADVHISAAQNVVKEIEEEAGIRAGAVKLTGCYDRRRHPYHPPAPRHCYKLYFLCEHLSGEPRAGDETLAAGFFPLDALPELSQGRVIEAHIREAHRHSREPGLPVAFD